MPHVPAVLITAPERLQPAPGRPHQVIGPCQRQDGPVIAAGAPGCNAVAQIDHLGSVARRPSLAVHELASLAVHPGRTADVSQQHPEGSSPGRPARVRADPRPRCRWVSSSVWVTISVQWRSWSDVLLLIGADPVPGDRSRAHDLGTLAPANRDLIEHSAGSAGHRSPLDALSARRDDMCGSGVERG